jgi:hypothetical protein
LANSPRNAWADARLPVKIPRQFWKAKGWFLLYAYWNRLLSELALSLTLGGVLYGAMDSPSLTTKGAYVDHCRVRRNRLLRKVQAYREAARGVYNE